VDLHLILLHLTLYRLSDLTEADVLAVGLCRLLDKDATEESLASQIEDQKAPQTMQALRGDYD
jgi:hypothetical protein